MRRPVDILTEYAASATNFQFVQIGAYDGVTGDPIFSRYHAKDDPYLQAGLLNLREFHPGGLALSAGQTDRYATGLIARKGASAVQARMRG